MARLNAGRPLVGVTGPDRGGLAAWLCTWLAVRRAGGRALRIRPGKPREGALLDALVIGGGADVDPRHYGEERHELKDYIEEERHNPSLRRRLLNLALFPLLWLLRRLLSLHAAIGMDRARDELEMLLLAEALGGGMPVLGICRGAQLINVALGGSLHQELSAFYTEVPQVRSVFPRKDVLIEPGSHLAGILGDSEVRVNALHNQAVKDLGRGLRIVAREPTGVVQGIERARLPLVIGVQWHPEYMPQVVGQQRIFRRLVAEAALHASARRPERVPD